MNIKSKIILVLLFVSACTAFATAWLGYRSGRDNLTAGIVSQLASLREVTAGEIRLLHEGRRVHLDALGKDQMFIDAVRQLGTAASTVADRVDVATYAEELADFYRGTVLPRIVTGGGEPVIEAYLPQRALGTYLQYHYLVRNPNEADRRGDLEDAGDGTLYSGLHRRIHPVMKELIDAFSYYDIFLMDAEGNVVYTASKEADFGTNLVDGPFADTGLGRAFAAARDARERGFVHVEDYSFYPPSGNEPSLFYASPVYENGEFQGVVAVQLLSARLDRTLNHDRRWEKAGLGEEGEMFVVGNDRRLRTTVRPFIEDREAYLENAREKGAEASVIERMRAQDSTILLQEARSESVRTALQGLSRVSEIPENYRGVPALSASAPLRIEGLDWAIVAEIPSSQAYAPIRDFGRSVLIVSTLLSILLTVLGMTLANVFTRPLRRLADGARRVAGGELDTPLSLGRRDEIGEVSDAMQEAVDAMRGRIEESDAERKLSDNLLARFLPDGVTRLIRSQDLDGDAELNSSEAVDDVALVFGRLSGFEDLVAGIIPTEAVGLIDELVQIIDAAAERAGVEKVRSIGDSYLAAAGLTTTHLDNDQRAVNFAIELRESVRRFAEERGSALAVSIGVCSGSLITGVIGRKKLAFDVFGPTVLEVRHLAAVAAPGEIRVSEPLAAHLGENWRFVERPGDEAGAGLALDTDARENAA